jgi:AcrR family transcriptional regulator
MPRGPRTSPRRAPSQKRAEDTVVVLLDATAIVLGKHGFHATTTNRIATAAGVSIGTLYHYFPSKEALIEAVVHRMWRRELAALEERASLLFEAPLDVAIRELVGALVALMGEQQQLYMRWYGEASHLGQLGQGLEMSDQAIALLRVALERRRDEVRPENIAFAADLVVKTALAVVRTGARDYARETKSGELAAELSAMLARYLMRRPP